MVSTATATTPALHIRTRISKLNIPPDTATRSFTLRVFNTYVIKIIIYTPAHMLSPYARALKQVHNL